MILNIALLVKIAGTIIGASLGYAYWYFVGCVDGCSIQSVWWRMSLWGAVMGFLLFSMLLDFFIKKPDIE